MPPNALGYTPPDTIGALKMTSTTSKATQVKTKARDKKTRGNVGASGQVKMSISLSRAEYAAINELWNRAKGLGGWASKSDFRKDLIMSATGSLGQKLDNI